MSQSPEQPPQPPDSGHPAPSAPVDSPAGSPLSPEQMGPVTTKFAKVDPGPSQKFGVLSFVLTLVGTALVVAAFTGANWFDGAASSSFRSVHRVINSAVDAGVGSPPVARAYFSWLGWALLVVAIALALLAATPTVGGGPFRVIGAIVAVAAIALTFVGIKVFNDSALINSAYHGYTSYLHHARLGFYLALAGFAVIGVGAALGPGKER